jgi:glutamate dehydrogenase
MQDDLSGLSRAVTADVVAGAGDTTAPDKLVAAWQDRNRRALERAAQLMTELRAVASPDAAMLSVALRELRSLA